MAKKKPAAPTSAAPTTATCSCHDMLMQIHDPGAVKSPEAQRLINAKQELDRILGLIPTPGRRILSPFALEPFGGSNIVCTAIHEKKRGDQPTGEFCITVFVRHKPTNGDTDVGNEGLMLCKIPESVLGVPTDVMEFGKAEYHVGDTGGPVYGADGWQGSFAAVVKLQQTGNVGFILSNQHVLNHSGNAANQNQPVYAPGSADLVGKLTTWTNLSDPHVDGALAVTKSAVIAANYQESFALNPSPVKNDEVQTRVAASGGNGFLVKKIGPITGQTFGVCTPEPQVLVNNSTRVFQDQLKIMSTSNSAFSEEGDSGSLVVTHPDNRPVGLLWGGAGLFSFANGIEDVMNMFQIAAFVTDASQIQP